MLALFQRLSSARPLAVLTLLYILFPAIVLPPIEAQLKGFSGGFGPIDLKFTYTPAEVFQMVEAYGEAGRAYYRSIEMTVDILYPLAYTLFFGALITAILRRAFPNNQMVQRLALLTPLCFLLDMAENVGIITMLNQYPTLSELIAQITSLFTTAKWVAFGAIILTVLVGLLVWAMRRFSGQPAHRPA